MWEETFPGRDQVDVSNMNPILAYSIGMKMGIRIDQEMRKRGLIA